MKKAGAPEMLLSPGDEEVLLRSVRQAVAERFGPGARVASVDQQPSSYASWYASQVVTAILTDGRELKMFLKNFGTYREEKEGMTLRRNRELRVYRDLLSGARLGTAGYLGAVWDEEMKRYWLLLEFVEGTPVRYLEFEHWVRAAGWLGRMHGHFHRELEQVLASDFLVRQDAGFYQSIADRALSAVGRRSPRLEARLAPIVEGYEQVVEVLAGPPWTLLHGTYRPGQIIVDHGIEPARICPTDWELAGMGSAFYDLAFLADGFGPGAVRQLFEAYSGEANRSGIDVPAREDMAFSVNCSRLHRSLTWLFKSAVRGDELGDLEKHLARAENLGNLVR